MSEAPKTPQYPFQALITRSAAAKLDELKGPWREQVLSLLNDAATALHTSRDETEIGATFLMRNAELCEYMRKNGAADQIHFVTPALSALFGTATSEVLGVPHDASLDEHFSLR